jgi:predicted alpha/beta superfamily hydrolase
MKKSITLLLFITCLITAQAQTIKNGDLIIGKVDSIYSKVLKEYRKVWIYLPASARNASYAKQHYPILYLLDGDDHFSSVTGMIQLLSDNTLFSEMIVVGIPNTDRLRDLTPTKTLIGWDGKISKGLKNSGGGEKFATFIEKELMPHIDSLYAASPYKIIVGHSLGGLTVMNLLVHHSNMFDAFVAIDPSMWWDNKKLLNETKQALAEKKIQGKSLFLAIANTMSSGIDTMKVRHDTSSNTAHIRSILELNEAFNVNPLKGLSFASKYYNDDNHGSVPLIAEYDALHFFIQRIWNYTR